MTTFLPNSKIAVSQQQARLNKSSVITTGEFISSTGDKALVMLEGEAVAREVPLLAVVASDELVGNLSSRPGEMPVIDMSPRRRY